MRDELTGLLLALAVVGCGTAGSDDREPLGKMVTETWTKMGSLQVKKPLLYVQI